MIPLEKKVTSQSIEPRSIPWKPSPIRQNDDEENHHHHLEIRIFRPPFLPPLMRTEVESERRFLLEKKKRKENKRKKKSNITRDGQTAELSFPGVVVTGRNRSG